MIGVEVQMTDHEIILHDDHGNSFVIRPDEMEELNRDIQSAARLVDSFGWVQP
jgi:hypothetical protein